MSMPEAREFVGRLIGQARHPQSFKGLEHDEIIDAADRNPLVLQWIIKQIDQAKQPRAVLAELSQGKGYAAERVFGRSFALLNDDGRAALLALSLFVPDASRPALSEVAGFGEDPPRLDPAAAQLAELWLANPTEGNERLTVAGLTRELAKTFLSTDPRAPQFRQRFIVYFQTYAEAHARPTPKDYDELEAERNNLLAAMDVALEATHWRDVMRISAALQGFLYVRGHWDEAIQRGEQAVTAAYSAKDEGAVARFAGNVALARQWRGEYNEAKQALLKAVTAFRELRDENNVAIGLHELGRLAQAQGEVEEARRLYGESLEINKRRGNQSAIASTTSQIGILLFEERNFAESKTKHEESLAIRRKLGEAQGIAIDLHQLAMLAQAQGELEEARRLYNESLNINKQLGDQSGIASSLHEFGRLAQGQGELEEARRLYNESLEIKKRLGDQSGIAISLSQLGILAVQEDDRDEATELLRESLSIFEKLKSPNAERVRRNLAKLEDESS
jgi:tetratricopeptide (TPR) repeat protein